MVSGEWTGTMNLTEPDAGSDVGALRTKAVKQDDGSYRITGQKIFITFGEHDLTEQIVHLVLARTPDAPAGTKGISLFIVPKFLVDDDGTLGERNDVHVVSIEHKMGIKASPTCVLAYGDDGEGAIGYLIGEENAGMRYMFTMMNNARLGVGVEGLGLAERSLQAATAYAKERQQGYAPGAARGEKSFIVDHPDVRRMLLTMRAYTESMRLLAYKVAEQIDVARHAESEADRTAAQETVDILIPLTKSYCTDVAETVTSIGIQVYGGMGYIEETGVAQHYRDAKITQIYEGTNGIQAMDLVGRKLPMRAGGVYQDQVARMRATLADLEAGGDDLAVDPPRAGRRDRHARRGHPVGARARPERPGGGAVGRHALPAALRHRGRGLADGRLGGGRQAPPRRRHRRRVRAAGEARDDPLLRPAPAPAGPRPPPRRHRRQGRLVRDSLLNRRFRSEVLAPAFGLRLVRMRPPASCSLARLSGAGVVECGVGFDLGETDRLLSTTRAVRRRLDLERAVDREVILDCLRLAVQAPTASNEQTWRWLVVTDAATRAELARLYREAGAEYLDQARRTEPDPQTARVYESAYALTDILVGCRST